VTQTRPSNTIAQFSRLLLCIGLGLTLSFTFGGCNLTQPVATEPVKEPPLIPDPADLAESGEVDSGLNTKPVNLYEDMAELSDTGQHSPRLREAVSQAIALGVLKPTSPQERFDAQKPICFGEFRDWAIAYQNATAQVPNASMPAEAGSMMGGITDMPASKLKIPPSSMSWEGHAVTESHILTRQELCALYVFLSGQDEVARKMGQDDIEAANPAHDPMSPDEAISQFKDYADIAPWARRYVAVAYQDGLLEKLFKLTPNQLTGAEGFSPSRQASREDVILLLDGLYGKAAAAQGNQLIKASDSSPAPKAQPQENPTPIGKLQSVRESGPGGTRSALRVSGPE